MLTDVEMTVAEHAAETAALTETNYAGEPEARDVADAEPDGAAEPEDAVVAADSGIATAEIVSSEAAEAAEARAAGLLSQSVDGDLDTADEDAPVIGEDAAQTDGGEPVDLIAVQRRLEALMFIASEPVPLERLAKLCCATLETTTVALGALEADYADRGIQVRLLAGGYRFATAPDVRDAVEAYLLPPKTSLSPAALETLAIVAYSQPVTKADIEQVRGVSVDGIVAGLVERGFVAEVGRKESAGRPILFGTTPGFLEAFGLPSLADLPPLPEERADQLTRDTALAPVLEGTIDEPDAHIVADGEAPADARDEDTVMNATLEPTQANVATMDPIDPVAPVGPTETVPEVGPIDPVSPMPPVDPGPNNPTPDMSQSIEQTAAVRTHRNDKDEAYVEAVEDNASDVQAIAPETDAAAEPAGTARWN